MAKIVVNSLTEPDPEEPKRFAMRIDLHENASVSSITVESPNLNDEFWHVGDTFQLTVIGVERRGSTEGVIAGI